LLGIAKFSYHPNGLYAVGTWRLAKRTKKIIVKLSEFSKSVEATFLSWAPQKGKMPLKGGTERSRYPYFVDLGKRPSITLIGPSSIIVATLTLRSFVHQCGWLVKHSIGVQT
jgi:hypothetical protein